MKTTPCIVVGAGGRGKDFYALYIGRRQNRLCSRRYRNTKVLLSENNIKRFKHWKAQQAQNRLLAGKQYDSPWKDFICVNELGG